MDVIDSDWNGSKQVSISMLLRVKYYSASLLMSDLKLEWCYWLAGETIFSFFRIFHGEHQQISTVNHFKRNINIWWRAARGELMQLNELGLLPKFIPRPQLSWISIKTDPQQETKRLRRKYLINLVWPDYLKLSRGQEGYRISG